MPGVIQQFRWSRLLAKAFDLKGAAPPLQVLDDVMPVAQLYDPTDVEHHFARDEMLFSVVCTQAAGGAGIYSCATIGCQTGYIVVIEGINLLSPATSRDYYLGLNDSRTATLTTPTAVALDQRFEQIVASGVTAGQGTYPSGTPTNPFAYARLPANTNNWIPVGVVLDDDDTFMVSAFTANEPLICTIFGYVRRAELSERR